MLLCLYDLVTAATRKEPAEKQTSQTTNLYLWLKQGIGWQCDWVDTTITVVGVNARSDGDASGLSHVGSCCHRPNEDLRRERGQRVRVSEEEDSVKNLESYKEAETYFAHDAYFSRQLRGLTASRVAGMVGFIPLCRI